MITHLETDILELKVKWALGSITTSKASGGDGIPVELFQILKDDAVKVLHSIMSANLENAAVATGLEKVSFHSNPKGNAKECSNYCTIALISHTTKVMLNTLVAAAKSLQSCLTLCNPIDGSPPGSPIPGILQERTLEWGAIALVLLDYF